MYVEFEIIRKLCDDKNLTFKKFDYFFVFPLLKFEKLKKSFVISGEPVSGCQNKAFLSFKRKDTISFNVDTTDIEQIDCFHNTSFIFFVAFYEPNKL